MGEAQGGDFLVNTTTSNRQAIPAVAMDADGDFVVAWESRRSSYPFSDDEVFAQRYNAAGVAQGGEFRVNTNTFDQQRLPAVAMDAAGGFVVAWESWDNPDGDGEDIIAQRYDAAGVPQGGEFLVNTTTTFVQGEPAVAMDADGDFVVTWHSFSFSLDGWNAFAQRYGRTGAPRGGEFRVNATTTGGGWAPAVAMESDGDFVVAWAGDDGDVFGIYGQRFEGGGPSVATDFNADAMSDILWRNLANGNAILWQMNGFTRSATASIGSPDTAEQVEDIGDFDGDGKSDILWRNANTGAVVIWRMDGFTKLASASIGTVGFAWDVKGVGDFDGDGKADILWHNAATGATVIWRMDGLAKLDAGFIGTPSTAWQISGIGDFDGDTKTDILWRNTGTDTAVIWRMDGLAKLAAGSIGAPSSVWTVEGVGDFDGDAKADILWRNASTGTAVIWQMNGFTREAAASIGGADSDWAIARLGDYDGGGQADILWRNAATGSTVIWRMNGLVREAGQSIGNVSDDWDVE